MKIIGLIKPFEIKQQLYVYDNGNKKEVMITTIDELISSIFELKDKYNINQIELIGAKSYSQGIKKQILKNELSKYNLEENTLEIEIK